METEKTENLQWTPGRGCRDALHLPVLVTLKSASQCFRIAEQGLFVLFCFFKRNGHMREKRKGYSKRGEDAVFVCKGGDLSCHSSLQSVTGTCASAPEL